MAKKPSNLMNMISTLFIITFISSSVLGFVYEKTKEPIARVALEKKISAVAAVVPNFDNDPLEDFDRIETPDGELVFYYAKKEGTILATAVETFSNKGFSGLIRLMVGLLPDGTIHDVVVVSASETPGLGDKIRREKSDFSKQFQGQHRRDFTFRVKQDGGDVDAITAATISSRAFCDAVERAYQAHDMIEKTHE